MNVLFKYLEKIPKLIIFIISVILVILFGVLDYVTGYEIAFSIFYLQPVSLASWFGKRSHAVIVCILSAATWLIADIYGGNTNIHLVIPVWNSIVRLAFFLISAFSLLEIKRLLDLERTFARTDFLTNIANSRAFYDSVKIESDRFVRFNRPFTVAYIDIDNFKQVNDSFGHSQGDNLLQSVAKTIKDNIRTIDVISRLGGDEFAILFPETNEVNARAALDKVQKALLDMVINNNWPVTFSIGAVICYKSCNADELIKEADTLMYKVKESGKNRIEYNIHKTPIDGC